MVLEVPVVVRPVLQPHPASACLPQPLRARCPIVVRPEYRPVVAAFERRRPGGTTEERSSEADDPLCRKIVESSREVLDGQVRLDPKPALPLAAARDVDEKSECVATGVIPFATTPEVAAPTRDAPRLAVAPDCAEYVAEGVPT